MKQSPLHDEHVALGAKLVPFGGWDMPLSYPLGTVGEHLACRNEAVAFDVSHLGTVRVTGADAFEVLNRTFTNDLHKIEPGRAQYTHLLDPNDASVVDDIIVWWVDETTFDVMPNASNTDGVTSALAASGITAVDTTSTRAVIAVQGPLALQRLAAAYPEAAEVGRFRVQQVRLGNQTAIVAGTGYTGESGVELAVPIEGAAEVWRAVLAAGVIPDWVPATPCGWRPPFRYTDMNSVPRSRHCMRGLAGWWLGRRAISLAVTRCFVSKRRVRTESCAAFQCPDDAHPGQIRW